MKKGYQRIGSIEDKMELDQSSALSGSRPIKPHAHPRPGGVPKNPSQVNDNATNETLTSLADVEDNAGGAIAMKRKRVKAAKPQALRDAIISAHKQTASPSPRDTALMCVSIPKMFLLTEATLFFENVLTTTSSDDKVTLSKRVKSWVSIVDANSTRSSSVSTSPHTSTAPPPSSTVATSVTGTVASAFEFESQLPEIDLDDPVFQFESQLPDDWNLPAQDKGGEANEPLEPVSESELLDNKWNSPVHQPSVPEYKGGEANKLVEPVVVDIPTLRDSQCATAMAKDHEADPAAAGLANIKRKATEMDYISTSEVELDDDPNSTIRVSGQKGAAKSSITVTKTMPKKIKMEASNSSIQTQAVPTQTRFNNSDLPMDLHKNQKWRREVIPTLILWAGNQENTFNITKQEICDTLREIIPVVYPMLKNTTNSILPNLPMVSVASQRLCDWRHGFASAAVAQVSAFFLKPLDLSPKSTAQLLLDQFTFLYEDLDVTVPDKAFRSVFVQQLLLGSHLSATKGYIQVPSLETSSLAKHGVVGALGLCSAALQRALNLITSGDVELKVPANAKVTTRDVRTPVKFNMASGKDSKTACAFSDQNWGTPTRKFTSAAQRRSTTQLQGIVELAVSSLTMGQELDPDALSDAGSDDEYALIFPYIFNPPLALSFLPLPT
ncbi:hypothetical protein EDD15DRAFT_2528599 [Pisolithus albus]|nr:hypothetical protein EDD15DRAFT_2528599 [Pisolithus albus]